MTVQLNKIVCGALAACTLAAVGATYAADKTLTVAWSGGSVAQAERQTFIAAFEKANHARVDLKASELAVLAQLESMVKIGDTSWDVVELSGGKLPVAADKGLLEPLDYSVIDPQNKLPAIAREKYGVVWGTYSTVLVQNTSKNPKGKKMRSWKDFWDVKTFPGPRSLRAWPKENLEYALLADGVDKNDIYKVLGTEQGLDRAFRNLDQIKPYVPVWWENGAQSVQLLADQEVYYSTTFNGRVEKLVKDKVPVEIVWNGGALMRGFMGIPKGSKNIDLAQQYIKLRVLDADLDRQYIQQIPYPSFAPGLMDGLKPEFIRTLPASPENLEMQFVSDDQFWKDNIAHIQERWNEWMLK
ncbi:MAG TPA: ABC transporter substrate-binding protein [Alcaligenes sp.]|nr:ABC transporter substrate-binding protein [Alcaligenes sp.]HRL27834.1 ABC transporter substrate-binding protein [Alcaligenes sp.]